MGSIGRKYHPRLSTLTAGLLAAAAILFSAHARPESPSAGGTGPTPEAEMTAPADRRPAGPQDEATDDAQTFSLTEYWLEITPDTIERKTLVNTEGEKLGDVTGVVRHKQTGEIAAVVTMGGFLGIGWLGGEKVAVPLDRMHLQANNVILFSPATRGDLIEQEGKYRPDDYLALEGDTPLGELPGVKPSPQPSRIASFSELDSDGNGALTRAEGRSESVLLNAWETYDRNNDDRIDRAEFGQFLEEREGEDLTPPEV